MDFIVKTIPEFNKQLRALLEKLELKRSKETDSGNPSDIDIEELSGKLKAIQIFAADYDRKGVLDTISEIKNCSDETRKVLDDIAALALHSEFETVEKTALDLVTALKPVPKISDSLINAKITGLDIIKGLQRYNDDDRVYLKVLRSYAASTRSMLDSIKNFSADKLEDYNIKIHGIKGSSIDIFAEQTGREAKELEEAAITGNLDFISSHNQEFYSTTMKIVDDIDALFLKLDAENPKPKKDRPDDKILSMLYTAGKNYDITAADNAISEIEKYKYESDDGLADSMRESFDRMDFKQIVQKLKFLDE